MRISQVQAHGRPAAPPVHPVVTTPARTVSVLAHRGASGYRPEHTLAAYELAIELGADVVEPDVVSTADGVLVARHENEIGGTTDVAAHPEFADRRRTQLVDGRSVTGWFAEDFTLAEIKTLRAVERLPEVRPGNTAYDGRFEIPTLDEVVDLVRTAARRRRRPIGIAPETKHPTHLASLGLDPTGPLLRTLRRVGWDHPGAPVVVQSFETGNLRRLAQRTRVPLMQLTAPTGAPFDLAAQGDPTSYADLLTPAGLRGVSGYARWIGLAKDSVLPRDADGHLLAATGLVDDAHDAGLLVGVYTVRDENRFLAAEHRVGPDPHARGDVQAELRRFLDAGVDGVFVDFPDSGVAARRAFSRR